MNLFEVRNLGVRIIGSFSDQPWFENIDFGDHDLTVFTNDLLAAQSAIGPLVEGGDLTVNFKLVTNQPSKESAEERDRMKNEKPWIYIAGPYSGGDQVINTRAAVLAGIDMRDELGETVVPVVPHLFHLAHTVKPKPQAFWKAWDMDLLSKCDAIAVLPGDAPGTRDKVAWAVDNGLIVGTIDEIIAHYRKPLGVDGVLDQVYKRYKTEEWFKEASILTLANEPCVRISVTDMNQAKLIVPRVIDGIDIHLWCV